jgi:hypothetical protein
MGSLHGDVAAQTKDLGYKFLSNFLIPKQPPKSRRTPVFSFPSEAVSSIHISNIFPELTCKPMGFCVCGLCVRVECAWSFPILTPHEICKLPARVVTLGNHVQKESACPEEYVPLLVCLSSE